MQQVDSNGNVFSNADYALTASWILTEDNDKHKIFKYKGNQNILDSLATDYYDGIYRYKIVVSTGKIYYSEPFKIDSYKLVEAVGIGDFDPVDFSGTDLKTAE